MKTLVALLVSLTLCICTKAFSLSDTDTLDIHSIRILTVTSDTVNLDNRNKIAVIFAGGYACSACYGELERAIWEIDSTIQIVVLLRVAGKSIVSRKEEIKRMERLVQSRRFYFDATAQTVNKVGSYEDGLFGSYNITVSPAVLFLLPEHLPIFLDYATLFGHKYEKNETITDVSANHCTNVIKSTIGE